MRKFFVMAAIVGLALLMAAPSWALDFKFGAEYRVRFYTFVNALDGGAGTTGPSSTFGDGANTNPRGIQLRVRPRFDVSDDNGNMSATLRLEIGDVEWGNGGGANGVANGTTITSSARVGNGTGGGLDGDGINVETKWAYVDFMSPFGIPLRWRAGLQPWYLPKGIIIDNDAMGLRAYGNYSIMNYEAAWYRASGGQCTNTVPTSAPSTNWNFCNTGNTTDNNLDYYQLQVGASVAKWLNPQLYYIYGRNAASSTPSAAAATVASQQFLGASITGDAGILKYDFDFVLGQANGGNNGNFAPAGRVNVSGWMMDAGVHIPVGPVLIHAVGSYATGDKQDGGRSEAFPYISPSWNGAGGLYEIPGSGGRYDVITMTQDMPSGLYEIPGSGGRYDVITMTQDMPTGLWMLGAGAEYRPVKALWLRFMYGFTGFSNPSANCGFNKSATAAGSACYGPTYRGTGWTSNTTSGAQGVGGLAGQSTMGNTFELNAQWDLWTNFKVEGFMGWMVPTKGDTAAKYVLQLYYNF